jgi:hypothetical protein
VLGGVPGIVAFVLAGRALRIRELRDILGALRRQPADERAARPSAPSGRESSGP